MSICDDESQSHTIKVEPLEIEDEFHPLPISPKLAPIANLPACPEFRPSTASSSAFSLDYAERLDLQQQRSAMYLDRRPNFPPDIAPFFTYYKVGPRADLFSAIAQKLVAMQPTQAAIRPRALPCSVVVFPFDRWQNVVLSLRNSDHSR